MAKKIVRISDISGGDIPEAKGAEIRVTFKDQRRGTFVLDVTDEEGEELASKGRKQSRRGRRPAGVTA